MDLRLKTLSKTDDFLTRIETNYLAPFFVRFTELS